MIQSRLKHLLILQVHNDAIDSLDLIACANEFVSANERRCSVFWKLS